MIGSYTEFRTVSRGLNYSDISEHVHDTYGISVSTAAISAITGEIIDTVKAWQQRPLDSHYPFVWLNAIHYKVRAQGRYQDRAVYTVLWLNIEGKEEVLGLYLSESEGADFWLGVLSDLQNRGGERYPDCFRGWSDRLSRSDTNNISRD